MINLIVRKITRPCRLIILLVTLSNLSMAQIKPFVPTNFKVPDKFENQNFRLRMLTVNDVVKDYDAVMTSIDHLDEFDGPGTKWPSKDLSLEQDLIDLGWHQKEFQKRRSFTFTVVSLDETKVLGCLYIFPTEKSGYDAEVTMWVRQSAFKEGLDSILFITVKNWISEKWPFKNVGYPGREISWEEWNSIE